MLSNGPGIAFAFCDSYLPGLSTTGAQDDPNDQNSRPGPRNQGSRDTIASKRITSRLDSGFWSARCRSSHSGICVIWSPPWFD